MSDTTFTPGPAWVARHQPQIGALTPHAAAAALVIALGAERAAAWARELHDDLSREVARDRAQAARRVSE